ncbi:MAG: ribonuclease H-like domain-containing protein [Acidobacteria bacterium]|nr:ribonuclease H-like domain-containing protein [Acidobacteriota bacterium]
MRFEIPPPSSWLYLDLETTSLAGGTGTYAFLIGLGELVPEGFSIRQFFLADLAAERALLAELLPLLEQAVFLVTYNGKLFDAAILDTRLRLARMASPLDSLPHFDLLYPARRVWKARWGSARLTELERSVLGYERADDVPGELIPQLYFDYLRGSDARSLEAVFRHNADDLLTLAALTAHLLELLAAPEEATCEPLEWLGLARLFERAGETDRARRLYERALAAGLPREYVPAAALRLAWLYKRQRDFSRAIRLWSKLVEDNGHGERETLEASEELAICYEHRLGEPGRAAEVSRRALAALRTRAAFEPEAQARQRRLLERFSHRLARLARKTVPLSLPLPT